ncbi:MAG: hypothetical protein V4613_03415 [Bacteroidota bacterium]
MQSSDPIVNAIIKSFTIIEETNTCELYFNDNITITLDAIKKVDEHCKQYTAGRKLKRLVVSGRNSHITREARIYGQEASELNKLFVQAEAVVVYSFPQKMVVNFYFGFLKGSFPMQFFTDIEKAREWLNKQ